MEAKKRRPSFLAPSTLIHPDVPSRYRILFIRCDLLKRQFLGVAIPSWVGVPCHGFGNGGFKIPGWRPAKHVERFVGG